MPHIERTSLMTLEEYAKQRTKFRASVLQHKKDRTVHVGDHVTLIFEDELTIRYQIQEMLRIEKTFEEAGIHDELDAYNPLVPDGGNWKATMLIEYPDAEMRKVELAKLRGVEHHVKVVVDGFDPIDAIADEDMERSNDQKTSAVHFLRFEVPREARAALRRDVAVDVVVNHPDYAAKTSLSEATRHSLAGDFLD